DGPGARSHQGAGRLDPRTQSRRGRPGSRGLAAALPRIPALRATMKLAPLLLLPLAACSVVPGPGTEQVTIPPGATLPAVADSLAAHRIISSRGWFRLLARISRRERRLQAGTYALHRGEGSIAALRTLTSGGAVLLRVTVPEGFTLQ